MASLAQELKSRIVGSATGEGLSGALLPEIARKAHDISSNPRSTIDQMESLVRGDPVVAAKVLQVAESPLYPRANRIESLREAIVRIGFQGIRNVIFMVAMRAQIARGANQEAAQRLWRHSIACAAAMQALGRIFNIPPDMAFLCGLMHDIGRIAARTAWADLERRLPPDKRPPPAVVEETIDKIHVECGVFLTRRWGLGEKVVEAIEKHHDPPTGRNLPTILAYANLVCGEEGWGARAETVGIPTAPYVQSLLIVADQVAMVRRKIVEEIATLAKVSG